jgi:hypothetical protein
VKSNIPQIYDSPVNTYWPYVVIYTLTYPSLICHRSRIVTSTIPYDNLWCTRLPTPIYRLCQKHDYNSHFVCKSITLSMNNVRKVLLHDISVVYGSPNRPRNCVTAASRTCASKLCRRRQTRIPAQKFSASQVESFPPVHETSIFTVTTLHNTLLSAAPGMSYLAPSTSSLQPTERTGQGVISGESQLEQQRYASLSCFPY